MRSLSSDCQSQLPEKHPANAALITCVIEVYSDGERRAHAHARLVEVERGRFQIIPFSLREVSGRHIEWGEPARGQPLDMLVDFGAAHDALRWWATQAMAIYAERYR